MKKLFIVLIFFTAITTQAQCWKQIDAGGYFTVGIKDDGTLWGWGHAYSGEFGSTQANFYSATPIQIGTDTDWDIVSAGNGHIMALKTDGTLWTWGRNDCGQLGNGEITISPNPVPQQIGDNDWASISAGHIHSSAIKNDGTLWTWGSNMSGQLGNGLVDTMQAQTIIPTQVGTDADWKIVCASHDNTAAIKTNGTLWITGEGNHGEIGNGEMNDQLYFTQSGPDSDWKAIALGGLAATAIKENGSLWGWGFNQSGGVGNGTTAHQPDPVQIGDGKWRSVSRGMNYFAGAVKDDGTLWTWGFNYYGPVGDGTTADKLVPVQIPSNIEWKSYTGGGDYSVALKSNGELVVWGYNYYGELGFDLQGNTILAPVTVADCVTMEVVNNGLSAFTVYPNPAQDNLYIETRGLDIESLTIFDISGKVLMETLSNNIISVQHLSPGIYIIEILSSGTVHRQKFVKQ